LADDSKKQQADAQFRKIQRAEDGKKAMAEYEAGATRVKTEKLRQLRLARDAAEEAAVAAAPAKKRAKKAKTPAGSLDNWLDGQAASGRNT
jgi:hypothetical protein